MHAGKVVNSALLEEMKGKVNLWEENGCVFAGFELSFNSSLLRQEFYPLPILAESQAASVVVAQDGIPVEFRGGPLGA